MNDNENNNKNESMTNINSNTKKKNNTVLITSAVLLVAAVITCIYFIQFKDNKTSYSEFENNNNYAAYRLAGNSLENFDLSFLQI